MSVQDAALPEKYRIDEKQLHTTRLSHENLLLLAEKYWYMHPENDEDVFRDYLRAQDARQMAIEEILTVLQKTGRKLSYMDIKNKHNDGTFQRLAEAERAQMQQKQKESEISK